MSQNNESYDSINTADLSSTSSLNESEVEDNNSIYEFQLNDGSTKICGLNKPQTNELSRKNLKNPINKNKIYNKSELENMLQSLGVNSYDARNEFTLNKACNFLMEQSKQNDSINDITNKKKCKFIETDNNDIKCINSESDLSDTNKKLINLHRNKKCPSKDIKHSDLVKLAKLYNVPYKGTKKQICLNLKNHYDINYDNNTKNNKSFCYKNKKENCTKSDLCFW